MNNMANFDENAIIGRIKKLRIQFAGKRGKSKFASLLGISPSTYNYYENNRVAPVEIIFKIWQLTGVDLEWLLAGRSSKGFVGPDQQVFAKLSDLLNKNQDTRQTVCSFIDFLEEKQGFESSLGSQKGSIGEPSSQKLHSAWIPVLGRTAAGIVHLWPADDISSNAVTEIEQLVRRHVGKDIRDSFDGELSFTGQSLLGASVKNANLIQVRGDSEQQIFEFIEAGGVLEQYPDSFALRIDGDSMAPGIEDGQVVIVSPSVKAVQGQAAVIKVENQIGVTCKVLRADEEIAHLIPINEQYETTVIGTDRIKWALAVLGCVKF